MPGYLLDTNHAAAACRKHPGVLAKLHSLPANTQVRVCCVTLGEIEAGHQMNPTTNQQRRNDFIAELNRRFLPSALPISSSTRFYYANIIGRIWKKNPPANARIKTERHLVKNVGVDINDIWSVATAWEHGLIFVTQDKMTPIRNVVPEVTMDCWL